MNAPALDVEPLKTPRRTPPYDPAGEIVAPRHLKLVVGISPVTAWRLRRAERFPAPIQLTAGRIGWRRQDLDQWLRERAAASR